MKDMENEIEKYLSGEMTPEEVVVFEEKLQSNPDLKREVALYEDLDTVLDDNNWEEIDPNADTKKVKAYEEFLKSEKGQNIITNIKEAEQAYFQKKQGVNVKQIVLYVVSIAAVFCILFFSIYDSAGSYSPSELAENYKDWSDLPSFTTKSSENSEITTAENLFTNKNYKEALGLFQELKTDDTNKDLVALYIGISQFETNQNENAIKTFKNLADHWKYGPRARWYLALVYLKNNNTKSAIKELEEITKDANNFNFKKAEEILNILKQ